MFLFFKLWSTLAVLRSFVDASPLQIASPRQSQDEISTMDTLEIEGFKPYTYYAGAAYCNPSTTLSWTCGMQYWYVGYDADIDTIIVGHQGTDIAKLLPVVTDVVFLLSPLDATLFPNVSSGVLVHSGFKQAHANTATVVLAAVTKAMSTYSTNTITVVGHSLGAAIALLDGVFLHLQLPSASVSVKGYGMPRVGNPQFADYVDQHLPVSHVNNKKDFVPILPERFLGFAHCSGEKHINDSSVWINCPGQDNESNQCVVGEVPTILLGNAGDHDGPYDGVMIGC
ncbi:lipase [Desarmillaria tabescens]|uniref:Lipase n=1 Tax=Armillaria tabescens TaxID=1929756 RepID=A0AA39TXK5_ARMTA|nr:lipase [Desarmillaria tabescens]KAK0462420.1 lipase [Desarmillaria tabescens]